MPRIRAIIAGIEAWLAGEPGNGEARKVVELLGERDPYTEKAWLARCLHNYLVHHVRGVD